MIKEILGTGRTNATSARTLCNLLNISPRDLTQQIEKERREGVPICASTEPFTGGYYLAKDKDEMREYTGRLKHRALEIFKTRQECIKTLESLPDGSQEEETTNA